MSDDRRSARWLLRLLVLAAVVAVAVVVTSGVWPPLLAVESGSMEPNIGTGDLVVVTAPGHGTVSAASDPGVVTVRAADGYRRFGAPGDVIVFDPPRPGPPIIHRAHFRVERGENWYERANESYLPPGVDGCDELRNCPAPHGGYVTKGDANGYYDQAVEISPPVRSGWIVAKAAVRIPELGWVRMIVVGRESEAAVHFVAGPTSASSDLDAWPAVASSASDSSPALASSPSTASSPPASSVGAA